jgi:hypothetical protein
MSVRRHWLAIITFAALLVAPFAALPRAAAQTQVQVFQIDRSDDVSSGPAATRCTEAPNDCSLRDAINRANSFTPADALKVISFQQYANEQALQSITAPYVFTLGASELPPITANNVEVRGAVNWFSPLPQIEIDGNGRNAGLQLRGNNGLIRGLSIYGLTNGSLPLSGAAIYIGPGTTGNRVEGSFIGINLSGVVPTNRANQLGIYVDNGATSTIIGSTQGLPNIIAGNANQAIYLQGAASTRIQNNVIGLAPVGNSLVVTPNRLGIHALGTFGFNTTETVIGGIDGETANVISGNTDAGVLLSGSGVISTTLQGNLIGTVNPIASLTIPNTVRNRGSGVIIEAGARGTLLAGTVLSPLVISDNGDRQGDDPAYGVVLQAGGGDPPSDTTITGATFIGTNAAGIAGLSNQSGGVLIDAGVRNTQLIGDGANLRISGNLGYGVHVRGAEDTLISGALIGVTPPGGTSVTGTNQASNTLGGVLLEGATDTTIRTSTISANLGPGITVVQSVATQIQENWIGLNRARTGTRGNSGPGISIVDSRDVLVGGPNLGNFIADNGNPLADPFNGHAVQIAGSSTLSVTVASNVIGLRCAVSPAPPAPPIPCSGPADYTVATTNRGDGVHIIGGGDLRVEENIIAASSLAAIRMVGVPEVPPPTTGTEPVTVSLRLNQIGFLPTTEPNVFVDRGNAEGIVIADSRAFEVVSNTVRFSNEGPNLHLTSTLSSTVEGNLFNNGAADGVLVDGTARAMLLRDNQIRANAEAAVRLAPQTRSIRLDGNQIAANGAAVLLEDTTLYSGSGADPAQDAPGANRDIDPPFNLRADQTGRITGQVVVATTAAVAGNNNTPTPISACAAPCRIQAFAADPTLLDGQGWTPLFFDDGSTTVLANNTGQFSGVLESGLPLQLVLAATDAFNNTSAFAVFTTTHGLRLTPIDPVPPAQNAVPTQKVIYRLLAENTGTVDYTTVVYTTTETRLSWVAAFEPPPGALLNAGATREFTVTVTLPVGTNPNAAPDIQDLTRVTANVPGVVTATDSLVLTTTVLAQPVLRVVPPTNPIGFGRPNSRLTYQHQIINDGNVPVDVQIDWSTIDPANSGQVWVTTVSTDTFRLVPGQTQDLAVNVTVPRDAQVEDNLGNPVRATTFLTATAVNFPTATAFFSDTTGVSLEPGALFFTDQAQTARAGATVTFFHTLQNESNGEAAFRFNVTTNFGSVVTLASNTPGIEIVDGVVTLAAPVGENLSRMQLRVTVQLSERRLPGDIEVINIALTDPETNTPLDANVVNTITITDALVVPRLWLPLIRS